jgi:hypothetical protein
LTCNGLHAVVAQRIQFFITIAMRTSQLTIRSMELRNLYSSPRIIKMNKSRTKRWAEEVARIGKKRNAYRLLVGKPEGNRSLGRSRSRWVDNIKMDLEEIVWSGVDWIGLANRWRALVNPVMSLRVP